MVITKNIFPILKEYLPANSIIVEAGSFDGRDTKKLSALLPNATIHAFEPVPEIYEKLIAETASLSNVHCYHVALSNTTQTATFYVAENPRKPGKICQAGTLMPPKERLSKSPIIYPKTIQVSTLSLAEWAFQNNINKVDFMWLDLQGHELAVLKGSGTLLKATTLIFLEVNFIKAYEDQPSAQEVDEWLKNQGFEPVARDFEDQNQWFFGAILYKRIN